MIALIPARAGSKRIPGKNTKLLAGHPLIGYTIAAAKESGVFSHVWVCSDDVANVWPIAVAMGVSHFQRHDVSDEQPDIEWVRDVLKAHMVVGKMPDAFAILRPTSPFRTAATIRRAYEQFMRSEVHSIRAVEPATQHPGKMWELQPSGCLLPLLDRRLKDGTPWHSAPTQSLREIYRQNASLEMAHGYVVSSFGTISGTKVAPFFTEGYEGFDINEPRDWDDAEAIAAAHPDALPRVDVAALPAVSR